jgi:hypothetical protein
MHDEVEHRMASYRSSTKWWRYLQYGLWSALVILGSFISIFAAFKTGHAFTIVAGSVVALITTFTNVLHPGQQADGYEAARLAIRDEGWALLTRTDPYSDGTTTSDQLFRDFRSNIRKIVATKRAAVRLSIGSPASRD